MIEKLKQFMILAGEVSTKAKQSGNDINIHYKGETTGSIVTEVDLVISELFKKFVKENFDDLDYLIIDEETVCDLGSSVFEKIDNSEYQFIIDPIDGTIHYANDIPLYGFSVGVFKNGRPYVGIIYSPSIKEMAYFDGKKAYWVKNAFTENENIIELRPENESTSKIILNSQRDLCLNLQHNYQDYLTVDYFCAVICLLFITTGRVRGGFFRMYLWDAAGAWPICDYLGIKMYNIETQSYLERISADDFDDNMRFKKHHIFACEKDLADLIKMLPENLNNS